MRVILLRHSYLYLFIIRRGGGESERFCVDVGQEVYIRMFICVHSSIYFSRMFFRRLIIGDTYRECRECKHRRGITF
jgi:hypothetical protein